MSDLYLVLRNRLDALPEWVFIDAAILRAAREAKGLSYETMARTIPVSAKTWERYEKAGRIPRQLIGRVAEILDLEIEQPTRHRVTLDDDPQEGTVLERLDRIERALLALDRRFDVDLVPRLDAIADEQRQRSRAPR